jgi:hypothetical protein
MLEIRKVYESDGIGSDFDCWQRRYRYFVVLHVVPLAIFWGIWGIMLATVR